MTDELLPLCECGCGERVTKMGNRFIQGHHNRCRSEKTRAKFSNNRKGKKLPDSYGIAISKALRRKRLPLTDDEKIDYNNIRKNKKCAAYLGCYIAEQLLSKIFKNVQIMPISNYGFDFICGNGYKIDVKSSILRHNGSSKNKGWAFRINKNTIPDFFLIIAFDNRKMLNPVHLWLIPGNVLNFKQSVRINLSTLDKWAKYEQSLDKVITCCNEMKDDEPKPL